MPAPQADLKGAIAEALDESKFPVTETLESQLATFDTELAEDEDDEVTDSTAPAETPSTAKVPSEASVTAEDEPPFTTEELETAEATDSYWGTDLTGIPVERKAALIRHLSQQDSTIQKLQAKLSEPLEVAPPTEADPSDEVSDAQLLAFYGIDPEDYSVPDVMKAALIKQGRNQLVLEDQVARLTNVETGRALETQWNAELDELESTYGKLPGSRAEVLRYALREEVVTPADLYFKLTAPIKRDVEGLVAKARREASKREQSGSVKPRSSSAASAPVQPGMTMRDAVKAAAMDAQKETGISWKNAVKRVLTARPESSE
jgi:hypothetical protein